MFAPKYRRKVFYGDKRLEIGAILRELCSWEGVNIMEAEVMPWSCAYVARNSTQNECIKFYGILKGKSSIMIYEKWGNMKYKYRNRQFWCRGYYVDTAGKNAKKIEEYIKNQLK